MPVVNYIEVIYKKIWKCAQEFSNKILSGMVNYIYFICYNINVIILTIFIENVM